jgi:carbonic anhydrase
MMTQWRDAMAVGSMLLWSLAFTPVAASEVTPVVAKTKPAANAADKAADATPDKSAEKPGVDPLETVQQKLARRLGAHKATPEAGSVVRVSTRSPGDVEVSSKVALKAAAPRADKPIRSEHAREELHWSYAGAAGPQAWGTLKPEFAKCSSGSRQSPIDIRDGFGVDLDPVEFDYRPSGFTVIDNGHTVQVNVGSGNSIQVMGRRYELVQFHFHRPSEERINGRVFDMVAHLVHQDVEGRLAVVAVLLDRGSAHPAVQSVWNNLPLEKGEPMPARSSLDLNALLPKDRRYYTYMGSLTTPPCSEGVLWMVMQQPVTISPEQIDIFARLYPMNARPIQSANGRMIKASN